ncbi:MAG: molybdopterin molybdotransferase MoeA [Candidatus Adiutrix sp.]|jgi:molybdopterin molybdotransferase|nr:molybdopterin molybdotransferase MoeA [Candidatus Adiutrix sp.]
MESNLDLDSARELMISLVRPTASEELPLSGCLGRLLAGDVRALTNVPPFDRSPYDGYAFRSADSVGAGPDSPVTLRIIEEIPAGAVPRHKIGPGTAAKILTGAPIPEGADAVVMYELTVFTAETVSLLAPAAPGLDIVPAGEDVQAGSLIARRGDLVDPALAGSLAAQGLACLSVFKKPVVGLISTGSELVEADEALFPGAIRNSNRYALEAACAALGAVPRYLGRARDDVAEIAGLLEKGLAGCDLIFTSGGVSVGDYDLTPAAMEEVGARILLRGLRLKPGGACAYAEKEGRLIFGLSGNPASAMTNFYAVAWSCLRKLAGHRRFRPRRTRVTLTDAFHKKSPNPRLICGHLDLESGQVLMRAAMVQGNAILRTLIGCDVMALIPAGSPPLPAGAVLDAFLLS